MDYGTPLKIITLNRKKLILRYGNGRGLFNCPLPLPIIFLKVVLTK